MELDISRIYKLFCQNAILKPLGKLIVQKIKEAASYILDDNYVGKSGFNPYLFVSLFLQDILQDLAIIIDKARDMAYAVEEDLFTPYSFKAFRNYAITRVMEGGHVEFAEWLKDNNGTSVPQGFNCRLMNQVVPFITAKDNTQDDFPLSGFENMMELAIKRIDDFVLEEKFKIENCFVIFPIPANWIYVVEFFRKYPQTEGCILEMWHKLFSHIINFGMFLNLIRAHTPILGCSDAFPDWRSIFLNILKEKNRQNKRILIFHHPECSRLGEVRAFYKEMEELIKKSYEN